MNDTRYIGLDVHQATISATVLDSTGKLVMEAILETKAASILQFRHGLRGDLQVTIEEGTCAAWLAVDKNRATPATAGETNGFKEQAGLGAQSSPVQTPRPGPLHPKTASATHPGP
jgi:hypothetical protein